VRRGSSLAPIGLAVVLAALYVAFPPHTTDLAAQTARAELFRRSGFVPYWAGWYSGITTTTYSLVTPPLLGLFGAVWLGGLSIVGTAAVVTPLLRDAVRPRLGAAAFVVSAYLDVVSGRTTFAVGAVIALAAVLAAERRRVALAAVLAVATTATSPVAGILLLLAAATYVLADRLRRRLGMVMAGGILATLAGLALLARGDSGGYQPFSPESFELALGTAAVVGLAPVGRRLRVAAGVTMLALTAVFVVHSPVGSNILRITLLAAVPTLLAAARLTGWRLVAVATIAAVTPALQLQYDVAGARVDDASRSFVAPLAARLAADPLIRDHRVEVVDTKTHWPSTYLPATVWLARGWERQVDERLNRLFYGGVPLTSDSYRAFLDRNAVGLVAVPVGVKLDFASAGEAQLVASGLPYLTRIWSDPNWVLYSVANPAPIAAAPATVPSRSDTGLTIDAPAAGDYEVRMRWSPYLVIRGGTVGRSSDDDVVVHVDAAGSYRLHAVWRWP
jgi:hypothetical protein